MKFTDGAPSELHSTTSDLVTPTRQRPRVSLVAHPHLSVLLPLLCFRAVRSLPALEWNYRAWCESQLSEVLRLVLSVLSDASE